MFQRVSVKELKKKSLYKILFGDVSFAPPEAFVYQIGKIIESKNFDITKQTFDKINGFTFSDEANILRYVSMGDTVYDVAIPDDALVFSYTTPEINKPCFITNKIIIGRPRKLTDKVCIELYKTSDLPLESYYQILPHLVHCNLKETAQLIIKEKVKENTYDCVSEITKFFNK